MKQTTAILVFLALCGAAAAQVDDNAFERQRREARARFEQMRNQERGRYNDAKKKAEADYAAFRKKANADYAAALQKAWQHMGVEPAEPKPAEPKPPAPRKPSPDRLPSSIPLPQEESVPTPIKLPPPPLPPIPDPDPEVPTLRLTFYGSACTLHADSEKLRFKLASADEKAVASAWEHLAGKDCDALLHDCLVAREDLCLSDWAYLSLLGQVSRQLLGGGNESTLLQVFLFTQSGYRARLARCNGRLVPLVPFAHNFAGYSYIVLDGLKHYIVTDNHPTSVEVCAAAFPREQTADIYVVRLPRLAKRPGQTRTLAAQRFGTMKISVATDLNLVAYLNDHPVTDAWDRYALTGLSEQAKASLYPVLRSQVEGKSKAKAAAMLLDFVQTAFSYATDQDQFGYERPLFADESFHYPKNDCEDRSIVYSILVRDLLGLDVVLVHYPGHLATAVAFPGEVDGDYFTVDGRRFTVCDPTYIGAGIGESMPQFQNTKAHLYKL